MSIEYSRPFLPRGQKGILVPENEVRIGARFVNEKGTVENTSRLFTVEWAVPVLWGLLYGSFLSTSHITGVSAVLQMSSVSVQSY